MGMGMGMGCIVLVCVCVLIVKWVMKNVNWWLYEKKLGIDIRHQLPPGDLGWPFFGNMLSFLRAYKSPNPESFLANFASRFGHTGLYKAHMFGNPSIIVTSSEACRKVLTDDDAFQPGWPASTLNLMGRKSFVNIFDNDHKWQRKLTAAPVNGFEALTMYMKYIEDNVVEALDRWADTPRIEFLTELRRLTFKIIMHIFLSSEGDRVREALEKDYTLLNYGVRAMAINVPGFAYYNALKARRDLVAVLQRVVTRRRVEREENPSCPKKDMMDNLLEAADENGRRLDDEEIIDILVMYLNAGHESSGHTTMWAALFLQQNPHMFEKAKAEQEETVRNRPAGQKGLSLKEIRKMDYLNKVIDETLRVITFSLVVFREAKKDVNVCGYTIPKGWKALVWFRSVHYDPETWPEPKKFDPSRWDNFTPKAGNFIPFGSGSRLCPGNDLAKLEIAIFLHYFLLNYELERENPASPVMYLPHTRPKDNCLGRIRRVSPQT
ncbi:ent-kaurenoic acid oxidase 1-like [Salvia splendens]|uniref:ent-kaurenoic acid oxidase 1-like n=1 Tax=Salvia splendens TaxID=180675 RepID=UPI001C277318|nr:ent-kaurenoic acid oxidase 1-like [Salvia splendens]